MSGFFVTWRVATVATVRMIAVAVVFAAGAPVAGATARPSGRIYYAGPSEACAADESLCAPRGEVWSIAPNGSGDRFESSLADAPPLPVFSHRKGLFAYFQSPNVNGDPLHTALTITPRGSGATRQLTTPAGRNDSPSWSRDDRWIAFLNFHQTSSYSPLDYSPTVWVVPVAGGAPRQIVSAETPPVTAGGSGDHDALKAPYPAWSPDGRWITFPRKTTARGPVELWAVSPTGAHLHQLTHFHLPETYYHEPGCASCGTYLTGGPTFIWSSRGRLAVVTHNGIFVGDSALRRLTRIASPGAYDPLFSPSGSTVLFLRDSSAPAPVWGPDYKSSSIYTVDTGGHNLRRVTTGNHLDQTPAWSPDGRWIAFSRDEALWTVSAHGTEARYVSGQALPSVRGYQPYNAASIWLP
jgi:dipeptidyl aminopeptidase/acylaminoacyl peptidase